MLELVALSEAMREAAAMAERVAATDANVLITGESGAGKRRSRTSSIRARAEPANHW